MTLQVSTGEGNGEGRGVASNLLGGKKEGVWGTIVPPPAGSRGRGPRNPQKPDTNANFQLRRGTYPCPPPWLCHWGGDMPQQSIGTVKVCL